MYVYGSLNQNLYPTLGEIKTAQKLADTQDARSRDQRPLMSILARISTASPRLAGLILTRKTALSSFEFTVSSKSDTKRAEAIKKRLENVYLQVCDAVIDAKLFGIAAVSIKWEPKESEIVPRISKVYNPTEIEKDSDGNVYILKYENNQSKFTRIPAEENETLLVIKDNSFLPGGILRTIVYHEYLRNETIKEWSNFNKKLKGLIQAKADDGQKQDAANALKNFILNNYAVTDKDVEFILNDLTSAKALESFPAFLDYLNKELNISILGQANTTELPNSGGSRASLQVLNLIRDDILYSDVNALRSVMGKLIKYDISLNVGKTAEVSDYKFDIVFDENDDLETIARVIEIALDNGIPLRKDEVYSRIGFSAPEEGDTVLEVNKAQASFRV